MRKSGLNTVNNLIVILVKIHTNNWRQFANNPFCHEGVFNLKSVIRPLASDFSRSHQSLKKQNYLGCHDLPKKQREQKPQGPTYYTEPLSHAAVRVLFPPPARLSVPLPSRTASHEWRGVAPRLCTVPVVRWNPFTGNIPFHPSNASPYRVCFSTHAATAACKSRERFLSLDPPTTSSPTLSPRG